MVKDGIIYRCIQDHQRDVVEQLVLPERLCTSVKTALHDDSGHFGFERTLQMIRERFYWPGMFQEVNAWCEHCERCCLWKDPYSRPQGPLVSIHRNAPMELVCIDFLTLEKSKGGIENVLVTSHKLTPQKTRKPAHWLRCYGEMSSVALVSLHADQGRNFESDVVRAL